MKFQVKTDGEPEDMREWWLEEEGDGDLMLCASDGKGGTRDVVRIRPQRALHRVPGVHADIGVPLDNQGRVEFDGID